MDNKGGNGKLMMENNNNENTENVENVENVEANESAEIVENVENNESTENNEIVENNEVVENENENEMSMQDLMDLYDKPVRIGQIIKGKIIQLDDKEAIVALVGASHDGKLVIEEATADSEGNLEEVLQIGQEIEAKVIRRPQENDSFYILSMVEMHREEAVRDLRAAFENNETITVKVKDDVKGGVVAQYMGQRVFIPASHLELHSVNDLSVYRGQDLEVNVIEVEEKRGSTRIVASRRKKLQEDRQVEESAAWDNFEVGQVLDGRVERLTDFGAFVNVNGVDGLLHVSEISYGKVGKPSDVLKVGEEFKVKIIALDYDRKRLSLSLKALAENPWTRIEEKYPEGSVVLGKVVRFTDFGAFIELEPGVDGLAHISQLSHQRVESPSDVLTIGETIKVKILDSSEDHRKVSLSIKAIE
ncbi:MAG: 30S ribosomal protein S1 [Clostridium sp.]|jgi:4-hydroxy-3-methylbut-2-enyl diphosphate reductase|nr:30S ribosomal protein S1 [Clostridium sp.]